MSTVVITINTDNAAFDGDNYGCEVAKYLRGVASDFDWTTRASVDEDDDPSYNFKDSNGNTVGTVEIQDD